MSSLPRGVAGLLGLKIFQMIEVEQKVNTHGDERRNRDNFPARLSYSRKWIRQTRVAPRLPKHAHRVKRHEMRGTTRKGPREVNLPRPSFIIRPNIFGNQK